MLPRCAGRAGRATAAKPITGNHDNNAPINISSDNFQADLNAKSGTYTGNVMVVQGDTKLRANKVRVLTVNGKADKITASGNVVVDSPASGTATGDNGVYSVVPRVVRDDRQSRAEERQGRDARRAAHRQSCHRSGDAGRRRQDATGTSGRPRAGRIYAQFANAVRPGE